MKKILWILFLGLVACEEVDPTGPDQLLLLSDREVVCAGQSATLRLFNTSKKAEVSISDFVFDPLPNTIGSISSSGLLTINAVTLSTEIIVEGTYKGKTKLRAKIKVQPASSSIQPSLIISPIEFFNPDRQVPYYFWPDGSVVFGTKDLGPESQFGVVKYSGKGDIQWKKDLGSGEAKFIKVQNEKVYAAGQLNEIGGAVFFAVLVFDLEGNLIFEKKIAATSDHRFSGFFVEEDGDFFISSFTNGASFVSSFTKYNSEGKILWEIHPEQSLSDFFIFPDGNFAAKSHEGWGGEPFLNFFRADGNILGKVRIDFIDYTFKGPNGTLASGYQIENSSNGTSNIYFDLYNSTGQKVMNRNLILADQPNSGTIEDPTQKKYAPNGFYKFFTSKSGEVHVLQSSFWGKYNFLNLNSNSEKEWVWWKENKDQSSEEVVRPLQILENGDSLILLGYADGQLYRFTLGKDYSFDNCLNSPYWNTLDRF